MSATSTHISCADTARLLRAALKREFPDVKFGVRSKTYSGGASISVSWTDGPAPAAVDRVANRYNGASFDGMIDLKSYHSSWLRDADGEPQEVNFGADYVFTQRDISPEWKRDVYALFSRTIGRELDVDSYERVPLAVDHDGRLLHMVESETDYVQDVFHRFVHRRAGGSLDVSLTKEA